MTGVALCLQCLLLAANFGSTPWVACRPRTLLLLLALATPCLTEEQVIPRPRPSQHAGTVEASTARRTSNRLTPKRAIHMDWESYAVPDAVGKLFTGLRGNRVEWGPLAVVSAERRRDNVYILVRGDPSLVDVSANARYVPIRDKLIAAFANRGQVGEPTVTTSATKGDGVRPPHFDMLLRVPKTVGVNAWAHAMNLWPGQRIFANGILVAGPWPVLLEVHQVGSSREALRHAQLMVSGMKRIEQERKERALEMQLVRRTEAICHL